MTHQSKRAAPAKEPARQNITCTANSTPASAPRESDRLLILAAAAVALWNSGVPR